MVQIQTKVIVADNSGARFARCIHIYAKNRIAKINDELLVAVMECYSRRKKRKKMRKGQLYRAILLRSNLNYCQQKPGPFRFKFHTNCVLLINKRLRPVGSKIVGPVLQDLRLKTYYKIIQLAPLII